MRDTIELLGTLSTIILPGGIAGAANTMRRSDLVQHKEKEKGPNTRTSQIVFGERQHLLRVLDSLEGT